VYGNGNPQATSTLVCQIERADTMRWHERGGCNEIGDNGVLREGSKWHRTVSSTVLVPFQGFFLFFLRYIVSRGFLRVSLPFLSLSFPLFGMVLPFSSVSAFSFSWDALGECSGARMRIIGGRVGF